MKKEEDKHDESEEQWRKRLRERKVEKGVKKAKGGNRKRENEKGDKSAMEGWVEKEKK